ncbi:hypothetical protein C8K30_10542 [Promicromonospora sp. AC04]|uniref:hypothetical protein n=1 Tax=Promicromonospora sp. AC04 TaxID=2135723 RepID=UPI000D42CEB3|nr:hypothetical protein [Promicromonospora sp. AC04]PUB26815.1 hypothetical protein C8K30_10542 [Promicromonospora sp. AC04]
MTRHARTGQASAQEEQGVWLASDTIGRIRAGGLQLPRDVHPPEGPHFRYDDGPSLFLGRSGQGPLQVAWDTNLLVDYFEFGVQLWEGESLPELMPTEQGEELEGLQMIVSLWVLRDIRFHILPGVIDDSKRKPLAQTRKQQRIHAWEEFCAAISLVEDAEDGHGEPVLPMGISDHDLDDALSAVPAGNDRALVRDALIAGMHVFLTCDKGILRARDRVAPLGLLLASPLEVVEELGAAGALHCLFEPRHLYWPMPDQQRVAHLIQALGRGEGR